MADDRPTTAAADRQPPDVRQDAGWGATMKRLLPALPAFLVLGVMFLAAMAFIFVFSFWRTNADFEVVPEWNLDNYLKFFTVPTYARTLAKTMVMAAAVTVGCLALAIPFCFFLVRYVSKRWQRLLLLAVVVPFWTSYLLRVYAWQAILGEAGALNQLLMWLGVIDSPARIFVYNDLGTLIVLIYVAFPFAALAVYASMERFDFRQFLAAQDLGARPDQAFRMILLPQIRPGLITACIFVFVPILGEFLTPSLVGGAQGLLIANLVVNFFKGAQVSQGAAIAFVIALIVIIVLVVFRRYLRVEDVVTRG